MKRSPIHIAPQELPERFRPLLTGTTVYDSSCSQEARVLFLERDGGLFLKSAAKGSLAAESVMARYFHSKGLTAPVLEYVSLERDWLLTAQVKGEDCTWSAYLAEPKRLCDLLAVLLRSLHETAAADCPVPDRTGAYLEHAAANHRQGCFRPGVPEPDGGFADAATAWAYIEENRQQLRRDTLIHGDFCLPNIVLNDWRFSGFIDLGFAGVGDRHMDLYWALWSLAYNTKTDKYSSRFLDAYGREAVSEACLRLVSAIELFG